VRTVRPTDYRLLVSTDGQTWRTVARVHGTTNRVTDRLHFTATRALFVQVRVVHSDGSLPLPMLEALRVR
jgi:hypothetical protein